MPVAQQNVLGDDKSETVDVINLAALNIDPSTPLWEFYDPISGLPTQYVVGDEVIYNGRKWCCISAHTAQPILTSQNGRQYRVKVQSLLRPLDISILTGVSAAFVTQSECFIGAFLSVLAAWKYLSSTMGTCSHDDMP